MAAVSNKETGNVREEAQMRFVELYKQLNPGQKKAVDTTEGPVMVLAGPGTGKTQTLAMRIANILQTSQMDPQNILCLTFTESGVAAMRNRLVSIIGTPAYYIRIHTFHSFCNDIIGERPELFAQTREWQVLSDVESVQMMQSLIDTLPGTSPLKPFGDPYLFLRDITGAIRDLKQEGISPQDFEKILQAIKGFTGVVTERLLDFHKLSPKERTEVACEEFFGFLQEAGKTHHLPPSLMFVIDHVFEAYQGRIATADDARAAGKARTQFKNDIKKWIEGMARALEKHFDIQKLYVRYGKELKSRGRYDYEDMILMVVEEFKGNSDFLAEYQEQFQYILVDEYQDTNGAQNEVVELLGSFDDRPNLFVVGDDKQSIYRFQGASLNNMLTFYERYKEAVEVVSLEENYRSQEVVLKAAHAVMSHNEESLAKYIPGIRTELIPRAGLVAHAIERHEFESEAGEEHFIAQKIQFLITEGANPSEIAVLFRYNRDGARLLRLLRSMGISVRLEAGEDVLQDIAVQQMLTLLAYIHNVDRTALLADILQYGFWQLPALDVLKVVRHAGRNRSDLLEVIMDTESLERAGVSDPDPFVRIADHIARWRQDVANTTLQDFLHQVLHESGWLEYLLQSKDHLVTLKKLSTVLNRGKEFNRTNPVASLGEFLDTIDLLRQYNIALSAEPWQVAENAVRLMTAHKAKGLEFEHVFLTKMNDGSWGNNRTPAKVRLPHGLVRYDMVVAGQNNEDERRLFYVAMTRAKKTLTLTRAAHNDKGRPTVPSIFVKEIPEELSQLEYHNQQDAGVVSDIVLQSVKPLPSATDADVQAWLKSILTEYVMSVTHLNNYLECPRKFYVKNLLQVPSARTTHQAMGTAVHAALDDFCRTFKDGQDVPDKTLLLERFRYHLEKEVLTEVERTDAWERGEQDLAAYYDHYRDELCKHTIGEYSFASHGVQVDGLMLTGLIDKIELINPEEDYKTDGTWKEGALVTIVDYKTGNPDTGASKIKIGGPYHRQLVFYKLLCDGSSRFPYEFSSAEVDFIRPSDKKGFVKKKVEVTDAEVEELKDTIRRVWNEIQQLAFLDDGAACGECEVCTGE
ncbi:MAG: ATP-dependent DNA helicase [Candidatus Andersenbacteria bacterium]